MSRTLRRSLLALLLLAGFAARASGLELAHRCPAAAPHEGGHDGHGESHRGFPAGADRCECVGQSCAGVLGVPAARPVLTATVAPQGVQRSLSAAPGTRPAVPHLLPFAQGPPA